MINNIKNTKGITLIALVVTIVILLILAGITINLVLADEGIFERTKNAKIEQRKAEILERLNASEATVSLEEPIGKHNLETYKKQILETEKIVSEVSEITENEEGNRIYEVNTQDGYIFTITEIVGTNVNDLIIEFKEYIGLEGEGSIEETQKYTISFNANGGTCDTTSITKNAEETYGTLPTPTREGFAFLGWYTRKRKWYQNRRNR